MDVVLNTLYAIDNIIWGPYILMPLLLITAIYFTFKLDFVQFKMFKRSVKIITQKNGGVKEDNTISPIEAFLIGLASRIGTGNIVGVALAIVTGGPGVIFWMWVVALLVSASSFVESTLAQLFKEKEPEKGYVGGPSYYMAKGFKSKKIGKKFGILFSILLITSYGLVFVAIQSNTIAAAFQGLTTQIFGMGANPEYFRFMIGVIIAIMVSFILFGGATRIASFSSFIVPIMAIGYLVIALIIAILNFSHLPLVFQAIFTQAFTPQAIFGTTIGGVIIIGAKRGMFSNEAGMGSAPNAAATATTEHPVNQGLIQSLGVFVDTILVCTATGVIILSSLSIEQLNGFIEAAKPGSGIPFEPISVVQTAFASSLGSWGGVILTIFIFFFAFSSIIGNYYYSESSFEFITRSKRMKNYFKIIVIVDILWASVVGSNIVWELGNVGMGLMAIVNIIGMVVLFRYVPQLLKDYKKQLTAGKVPEFNEKTIPELKGKTVWTDDRKELETKREKPVNL